MSDFVYCKLAHFQRLVEVDEKKSRVALEEYIREAKKVKARPSGAVEEMGASKSSDEDGETVVG